MSPPIPVRFSSSFTEGCLPAKLNRHDAPVRRCSLPLDLGELAPDIKYDSVADFIRIACARGGNGAPFTTEMWDALLAYTRELKQKFEELRRLANIPEQAWKYNNDREFELGNPQYPMRSEALSRVAQHDEAEQQETKGYAT